MNNGVSFDLVNVANYGRFANDVGYWQGGGNSEGAISLWLVASIV